MLYIPLIRAYHRYLKNLDCSSFVMCPQQQGRQYVPLISPSFLDVCGAYKDEATNGTIKPFTAFSDYV
jgi:hypothetical protein